MSEINRIHNSRSVVKKEPRDLNKKNPGKTYLPRFLDETDISTLKSSVDRELADISMYMEKERQVTSKIIPGSSYKGTWDACLHKYPDPDDENSTWDVIVSCGPETTFDGKVWKAGQQLIYLHASRIYVQRTNPAIDGMKHEVDIMKVEIDNSKAKIEENKTAIADTNFALAETKKELEAKVQDNTSKITQTNQTVTDLKQTVATNKTELESKIGDNKAQIEQTMQTVAKVEGDVTVLESKWTVSTNVNGYISGIEMVNNGRKSQFTILTDQFKVTDGSSTTIPFTIEGGKTTMNNCIVRGHLEAASGTFTGAINAATITGSQISGNNIRGGDLNIGNGQAIIYSDGRAVFKNADVSGAIRATSGEFQNVIIHESCDFRGTVTAEKIRGDMYSVTARQNDRYVGVTNQWVTITTLHIPTASYERWLILQPALCSNTTTVSQGRFNMRILFDGSQVAIGQESEDSARTTLMYYRMPPGAHTVQIQFFYVAYHGSTGGHYQGIESAEVFRVSTEGFNFS